METLTMFRIPVTGSNVVMKIFVVSLVLLSQCVGACAIDSQQPSMNKIINLGEAASIRVLSTPERELVRAALTPELLRANYRSAFELKRGAPNWKDFERSIGRTTL